MNKKTYEVQNLLKRLEKFNDINIIIKTATKEFDINFANKYNPHLLGLAYITERKNLNGMKLYNTIINENFDDEKIFQKIEKNHGKQQLENVKNRISTFENFLCNLEEGILVEKTLKSKMNVNYLIIQNKEKNFFHLGIMSSSNGALLTEFDNITDEREKDILRTYFIEKNSAKYFDNTNIAEFIISIEKYDEKEKEYIPFSFDETKNKELLEKFYKEKISEKIKNKSIEKKLIYLKKN